VSLTDLGSVNLLVGANDSGKTSLLEALSIFAEPLNIRAWLEAARLREIGPTPLPALLEWLFPHSAEQISANGGAAHASISGSGSSLRFRRELIPKSGTSRFYPRLQPVIYLEQAAV
jgi:hypothetical protein